MDGLSKRPTARVTAATSVAWFSTVTEAAQWSPGRSAVLDLSLEEFVARANSVLNRSMKMARLYAEPASVTPSDGVFTRTFRWVGREGDVQFMVVANEKLRKIRDISVQWRRRCGGDASRRAGIRHTDRRRFTQTECT
jgi:hypothetical protein